MRQIRLLLVIAILAAAISANAAPCPTLPLGDPYLSSGFTCEIGIFTFKNFFFENSIGAIDSSQILMTPIELPNAVGFQVSGVFDEPDAISHSYTIYWEVDPPPSIIHGQQIALDPTGNVTLTTGLCSVAQPCPIGNILGTLVTTTLLPTATITFSPDLNFLAVNNQLSIQGPATSGGFTALTLLSTGNGGGAFADTSHLVGYASNLLIGDSVVNLTNSGVVNGFDPAGGICANVYAFDPSEEMVDCCACYISPDGLRSISIKNDIMRNTLTPGVPGAAVIKLLASQAFGTSCDPTAPTTATLKPGLRAWGTTLHQNSVSGNYETAENIFQSSPVSDSELAKLTSYCGFIRANGSGFGLCKPCRLGGLGGAQK